MISEISPQSQEVKNEIERLKNKNSNNLFIENSLIKTLGEKGIAKSELVFEFSIGSDFEFYSYSELLILTKSLLDTDETFEIFCNLESSTRHHIFENSHPLLAGKEITQIYISFLHLLKAQNALFSKNRLNETFATVNEIRYDRKKPSKDYLNYEKFFKYANNISYKKFGGGPSQKTIYLTVMFLLRELFGESIVTELLQRLKDEQISVDILKITKILENWDQYRELPLSWTLEIMESKI
jgi:hypothetical protein